MTSKNKDNLKFNLLIAGQFFVVSLLVFKLFKIQVLEHSKYKAMAEDQYWSVQEIPAKRGDILSSDGYPLATTQKAYLLYAEPDKIDSPDLVADKLADIIIKYKEDFYEDEDQKEALFYTYKQRYYDVLNLDLKWAVLEHYLSEDAYDEINNLGLLGVGFEEEPRRYYPEGTLASHILGFVAKNNEGKEQGYFGIEGYLNGDLQGKQGRIVEEHDAKGDPILIGGYKRIDPIEGRDVVLTINRAIQYIVEKKLKEGVQKYGAVSGSVIVMNPMTGDILAMANYPTYHPARFNEDIYNNSNNTDTNDEIEGEYIPSVKKENSAITESYEPGSVMKPLTVSSGIDLGIITPQTTFEDNGPVVYSGHTIDNWDGKHHGTQTIVELLQKSNNIGAAWVGHKVGSKNLYNYLDKFGIGKHTSINLEGENAGILRNYKEWTDIDLANISFGQGVSATPLQILNAFNAIANGGKLMRPRIVSRLIEEDEVIEVPTEIVDNVISKDTSEIMVDILENAVSGGESKYFNIENYDISGKTGTAQIAIEGEYVPDKTNTTFAGFLTNSKRFSMIVRLERPSSSVYAAETAVPLWMNIAEDLIRYYGVAPDKN